MSEPHLELKINLSHDKRNQDKDIKELERNLLNHINFSSDLASSVKIGYGYRESGIIVELSSGRWRTNEHSSLEYNKIFSRVIDNVMNKLMSENYADDLYVQDFNIKAVVDGHGRTHKDDV